MKVVLPLLFFAFTMPMYGQINCDELELIGIYSDLLSFDAKGSILLTRKGNRSQQNADYSFQLYKGQDTLAFFDENTFHGKLPNTVKDTLVYDLKFAPGWGYGDLQVRKNWNTQKSLSLKLHINNASCELDYRIDSAQYNLTNKSGGCEDIKLHGLYKIATGDTNQYLGLIINSNKDSVGKTISGTGYTSFQFYNQVQEELTLESNPGYSLPLPYDTLIVHFDFIKNIDNVEHFTIQTKNPECTISYNRKITSLQELESEKISIHPNPSSGIYHLSGDFNAQNTQISVHNLSGKLLHTEKLNTNSTIDLSHLPQGVYFLELDVEGEKVRKKIVKE